MLSYIRYNRISNGDYCKCMCLYSNECEIPELSNILDFTVVLPQPPVFPEIFPLFFTFAIQRYFIWLARDTQTEEVKSLIFSYHRPPAYATRLHPLQIIYISS